MRFTKPCLCPFQVNQVGWKSLLFPPGLRAGLLSVAKSPSEWHLILIEIPFPGRVSLFRPSSPHRPSSGARSSDPRFLSHRSLKAGPVPCQHPSPNRPVSQEGGPIPPAWSFCPLKPYNPFGYSQVLPEDSEF